MVGREHKIMITAAEAVELNKKCGTIEEWYLSKDIYNEWKKHLTDNDAKEPEFAFFELLSACFNAGRVNGIREERAARKQETEQ